MLTTTLNIQSAEAKYAETFSELLELVNLDHFEYQLTRTHRERLESELRGMEAILEALDPAYPARLEALRETIKKELGLF